MAVYVSKMAATKVGLTRGESFEVSAGIRLHIGITLKQTKT